jgi:hypothetical protein
MQCKCSGAQDVCLDELQGPLPGVGKQHSGRIRNSPGCSGELANIRGSFTANSLFEGVRQRDSWPRFLREAHDDTVCRYHCNFPRRTRSRAFRDSIFFSQLLPSRAVSARRIGEDDMLQGSTHGLGALTHCINDFLKKIPLLQYNSVRYSKGESLGKLLIRAELT